MTQCKYQSFTDLSKINDSAQLLEQFKSSIAPEHQHDILIEVFENSNNKWTISESSNTESNDDYLEHIETLTKYIKSNNYNNFFVFNKEDNAWYCTYHGLAHADYAFLLSTPSQDFLVDSNYIQELFYFYCHQLHMLHGTYHDALTGLLNRKSFDRKLTSLLSNSHIHNRDSNISPSFYVMIDIDKFKLINDTYGHLHGDEVLLQLARLMEESFRDHDLLFRYGGEEFAVVLMSVTTENARSVLERFRKNVEEYSFPKIEKVTVSIGFTTFNFELTVDDIISQADSALYYCKDSGRNQVNFYEQLVQTNKISPLEKETSEDVYIF